MGATSLHRVHFKMFAFFRVVVLQRSVCRKHEMIQYDLEMAVQDLAQKKQQKDELVSGVGPKISCARVCFCPFCFVFYSTLILSADTRIHLCVQTVRIFSLKGMTSKLFGQETQEQRESRLGALEQSIQEGETTVLDKNKECR